MTLVAMLALVALLQRVTGAAPLDARAALALGSVIILALAGGALARQLTLPRITGFLLIGILAGPGGLGVLGGDALDSLRLITDGALALIAIAVGCELRPAARRAREERTALLRLGAAAVGLPFLAVGFVAFTVIPWFPLTRHQPFPDALAVVLTLAVVAAVSSPALVLGVVAERAPDGAVPPVAHRVLQVTAVQLLVAALLCPLLLTLAGPLASAGAVTPGVAVAALRGLAGAVGVGLVLGYGIVRYLTALPGRTHALWIAVAAAFLVAQAARWWGLDVMLCGLVAGACAGPPHGEAVRRTLRTAAAPVHLVFFALLGSALRFDALRELWPWVLLFAGLRLVSLLAGWRWATRSRVARTSGVEDRWGGLGLVSQGTFAITLGAFARQAFPEWGVSLEALILAMVGVHAVAGPVGFAVALRNTVREDGQDGEDAQIGESSDTRRAALVPGSGGARV
ncbi:MAG: hypothetical protein ACREMN_01270 [Gemmatimonadales bacterium]